MVANLFIKFLYSSKLNRRITPSFIGYLCLRNSIVGKNVLQSSSRNKPKSKAAMNLLEDRSLTTSKCTALIAIHTNIYFNSPTIAIFFFFNAK